MSEDEGEHGIEEEYAMLRKRMNGKSVIHVKKKPYPFQADLMLLLVMQ